MAEAGELSGDGLGSRAFGRRAGRTVGSEGRERHEKMGAVSIIPVGDLMRELVLALGAALIVGSIAVLVRERRRKSDDPRPKPNMKIVVLNLLVGAVMTVWGLGSLIAAG